MHSATTTRMTRHMQARMSQRGIPGELVDLVRQYGRADRDRLVLNRRDLRGLLGKVRDLERMAIKALDKRGVVVEADGALATTYNADSFDPRGSHAG
jgi:hypothetical protein